MTEVKSPDGQFTATVARRADRGNRIVVRWGCGERSFADEDLRSELALAQMIIEARVCTWQRSTDSSDRRFACRVDENGLFHATETPGSHAERSVPWTEFKAALEAALNETPTAS